MSAESKPQSDKQQVDALHLSREETREIVTPYAFGVAHELIGTPLAAPWKRALAVLLDVLLISLLTTLIQQYFAACLGFIFFWAGYRTRHKGKKWLGYLLMAVALALISLFIAKYHQGITPISAVKHPGDTLAKPPLVNKTLQGVENLRLISVTAKYLLQISHLKASLQANNCKPAYECWQAEGKNIALSLADSDFTPEEASAVFAIISEESKDSLSAPESEQLRTDLQMIYDQQHLQSAVKEQQAQPSDPQPSNMENVSVEQHPRLNEHQGVIAWIHIIATDLGIGFGWAACYFTFFTAWWRGQTPGKKLFGLRVIKLDANYLSLWESFGRYGGYGAGLATGLLGFLQIYWDPNRQAIEDKISETLVIDLRKPKRQLVSDIPSAA